MSGAIWAIFTKDSTSLENKTLAVDDGSETAGRPSETSNSSRLTCFSGGIIQDEIGSMCFDATFTVCLAPQRVHSYSRFDCVPLSDNRVSTRSTDI